MKTILKSAVFPLSVMLLMAADPAWKTKQLDQWSEQDAKSILTNSPWVKKVTPALLPQRGEDQRRVGGAMGGDDGVGLDVLTPATLLGGGSHAAGKRGHRPGMPTFEIRWESARPVRTAEVKAHEEDSPDVAGGNYVVAVYDVPGIDINQKTLAYELKREAVLKFQGKKKDRHASRVDLLPQEGGLTTIVYVFPRAEEITTDYGRITFMSQVGRLSVAQYFYPEEMQIQGKLEL
jgi:hypothetical protein